MHQQYTNTAISLVDLKETALYFDHVIPVNQGYALMQSAGPRIFYETEHVFRNAEEYFPQAISTDLLPPNLKTNREFADRLEELQVPMLHLSIKLIQSVHNLPQRIRGVSEKQYENIENQAKSSIRSFLDDFQLNTYPFDSPLYVSDNGSTDNPMISIAALNLIDITNTKWNHILEFRKSQESRRALRRLRLFAFENYNGKPRNYIEDDLGVRVAEYQAVVKEWGFETRKGAITSLIKSKTMAGALTGTLVSTLFGQPLAALATLAGGALIEFAGVALEVQSRRYKLEEFMRENPVTFIDLAQKTLKDA